MKVGTSPIRPCRAEENTRILGIVNAEALLRKYWTISDRQIETSVVLAKPPLSRAT